MIYSTEKQTHPAEEFVINEGKVQYGIARADETRNITSEGTRGRRSSDGASTYFLGLYVLSDIIRVWTKR